MNTPTLRFYTDINSALHLKCKTIRIILLKLTTGRAVSPSLRIPIDKNHKLPLKGQCTLITQYRPQIMRNLRLYGTLEQTRFNNGVRRTITKLFIGRITIYRSDKFSKSSRKPKTVLGTTFFSISRMITVKFRPELEFYVSTYITRLCRF